MKRLLIISAILGIVAVTSSQSKAQVGLQVNIGTQPTWVPSGYQNVNYYYLPEVQSYYYVPKRQFVYLKGNHWTRSKYLPARYRRYDLNRGRKIIVYGDRPYQNYNKHYATYANHATYHRTYYRGERTERRSSTRDDYKDKRGSYKNHEKNRKSDSFSNGNGKKHDRH